MAATAAQIAQLRRRTGLVGSTDYSDPDLAAYIERYPTLDDLGSEPGTWLMTTTPPTWDPNEEWIPTYDLAAAAADIWAERAATLAPDFTFSADGGTYNRDQAYQHFMAQSRYWSSRRGVGTIEMVMWPDPSGTIDSDLHN